MGRGRVGAARERALVLARGWACLYARGRARCAALQVRVAADVRVLGRIARFLELRPVGWGGFPGRALAREPGLRGARPAVGWRRLREGAQDTPAARRGGGREAGCARKVAGWALPARVTSPGRSGEASRLCGLASGPAGRARWLVLQECGAPSSLCGVGAWERAAQRLKPSPVGVCGLRAPSSCLASLCCFVQRRGGYSRRPFLQRYLLSCHQKGILP